MLVLTRKKGEIITIGDEVKIQVLGFDARGQVRLGIEAPKDVRVVRCELAFPSSEAVEKQPIKDGAE